MAFMLPVALAVGGAGGLMSAVGTYSSMKAQAATLDYNSQVAQQQAQAQQTAGDIQATNVQRQYAALEGTERADYGASGVELAQGTPLAVLSDQAVQAARDVAITRYNTAVGVSQSESQANLLSAQSSYTSQAAPWMAGASFLGAASKPAAQYGLAQLKVGNANAGSSGIYSSAGYSPYD